VLLAVIKTCRKERGYCASRSQAIDCLSSVLLHKAAISKQYISSVHKPL